MLNKMKNSSLVWIAVGLCFFISPSLTQTVTDQNMIMLESSTLAGNDLIESNKRNKKNELDGATVPIESLEELPKFEEDVNIVIEENNPEVLDMGLATDSTLIIPDTNTFSIDDDIVPMRDEDFYYNDVVNKDPNEIMDTAAGFVPIPIFRKKHRTPPRQKPYASRRYFRRPYAYRRYYYFYPYYGYYPSSLRYY